MEHLLVLRFSAMGDVLMTVPVVDAFARRYPDVRVTVVSRAWARPVFALLPPNVKFIVADLKGTHAGFDGLNLLFRRLLALQPTQVADLHDVLRTRWLRWRFRAVGIQAEYINKNRRARKDFIKAEHKVQQRTVFEQYADVFRRMGYADFQPAFQSLFPPGGADLAAALPQFSATLRPEPHWVGIAPFATHSGKVYPPELTEQVVAQLASRGDVRIFLFGAGMRETACMSEWAVRYPHTETVAGMLNGLGEELALISRLKVMLSMDSANMHLASLAAVPVVSIWGATHPLGGFLGWGQHTGDAVQRTDLSCRPCSTYGNKPCRHGDYPCLSGISPHEVVARILRHLDATPEDVASEARPVSPSAAGDGTENH